MEKIILFRKSDFTKSGAHIPTGKMISDLQNAWEKTFYNQYKPNLANIIEGHPSALIRLMSYFSASRLPSEDLRQILETYENGNELSQETGEMLNSNDKQVYALESRLVEGKGKFLVLHFNDNMTEDILLLRFDPESDTLHLMPIIL